MSDTVKVPAIRVGPVAVARAAALQVLSQMFAEQLTLALRTDRGRTYDNFPEWQPSQKVQKLALGGFARLLSDANPALADVQKDDLAARLVDEYKIPESIAVYVVGQLLGRGVLSPTKLPDAGRKQAIETTILASGYHSEA